VQLWPPHLPRGHQKVTHHGEPTRACARHPRSTSSSCCCIASSLGAGETAVPLRGASPSAQKPKASADLPQSRVVPGGVGTEPRGSGPVSASSEISDALGFPLALEIACGFDRSALGCLRVGAPGQRGACSGCQGTSAHSLMQTWLGLPSAVLLWWHLCCHRLFAGELRTCSGTCSFLKSSVSLLTGFIKPNSDLKKVACVCRRHVFPSCFPLPFFP